MHPRGKTSLLIWVLLVELLLAAGISASICILRRDERNAFRAWRDNPTTHTRAALDSERSVTLRHHLILAAALFVAMAAISLPVLKSIQAKADQSGATPPATD